MRTHRIIHFVSRAGFCGLAILSLPVVSRAQDAGWGPQARKLEAYSPVWHAVPGPIVDQKLSTGMLLGNGDLGVVVGDTLTRQTFYFGKSDFWGAAVKKPGDSASIWQASILSVGGMTISSPASGPQDGSAFSMRQDLARGCVGTSMGFGKATVRMNSWTGPDDASRRENYLITSLVSDRDVPLHLRIWVPSTYRYGGRDLDCSRIYPYTAGTQNGMLWAARENYNTPHADRAGDYQARVAFAAALKGAAFSRSSADKGSATGDFILKAGRTVYIVVAFTSASAHRPETCPSSDQLGTGARMMARRLDPPGIGVLEKRHEAWWKAYWMKSTVTLGDTLLEQFYDGSLYMLGCASRAGHFPPSLFGNWITTDLSSWGGRYFLNYNEEAAYYGVFSANRCALAAPYLKLIFHEANWQENKTHQAGYRGICHQRSMTPYDLIFRAPALRPVAKEKDYRKLPADQKSNGAFAAMPLIWYYEYTRDTVYLREQLYPYLKKLEAFYDDFMDKSSRPYHIRHSSAHEGSDDTDPNLDIGFCRRLCKTLLEASKQLHRDPDLRKIWQDDLENLADYPSIILNGERVYTESATKKGSVDPDQLFHPGDQPINLEGAVFPGENIFLGGDSSKLQIARQSLGQLGGWCLNQGGSGHNGFPKVWPVAARIGWPAEDLYARLKAAIRFHWRPSNLTAFQGGGGIETAGAIEGINSMLMQSEGGTIRVFPDWPWDKNASFTTLRAKGAFLISSSLQQGKVQRILLTSEQGGRVSIHNPWKTKRPQLSTLKGHQRVSFRQSDTGDLQFDTRKGVTYVLTD